MRVFVDADILIWHLRGESRAAAFLRGLRETQGYQLWIGAMQRAEIVFFMREQEKKDTLRLLSLFETAPIDHRLVDLAGGLFRKYNPSHGTDANDALLAATVLFGGGKIYTLNTKHFPMPDLVVEAPW